MAESQRIHHTHDPITIRLEIVDLPVIIREMRHTQHLITKLGETLMSVIHDFRNKVEENLTSIRASVDRINARIDKLQASAGQVTPEDQADLDALQKETQALADALNSTTAPVIPPLTDAGNIGTTPGTPPGTAPGDTNTASIPPVVPGGGPGIPPTPPASPIDSPAGSPPPDPNKAPAPLTGILNPPGATTAPDGFNNATAGVVRGGTTVPSDSSGAPSASNTAGT